ncbi:SDR family oxidoreductase [Streptomyces sp. NBC_00210]|uniref:SDR family NAD(P)-dependent oxidoreductase n=1 Tax=Streptomyces sp. NBC_00210 TaxID=2903636 RepID=UPI00324D66F2
MSGGGAIVFIGSLAGLRAATGSPAYDSSKAGLVGLTRHVARKGAARRIRANVAEDPGRRASAGPPVRSECRQHHVVGRAADFSRRAREESSWYWSSTPRARLSSRNACARASSSGRMLPSATPRRMSSSTPVRTKSSWLSRGPLAVSPGLPLTMPRLIPARSPTFFTVTPR